MLKVSLFSASDHVRFTQVLLPLKETMSQTIYTGIYHYGNGFDSKSNDFSGLQTISILIFCLSDKK